MAENTIQVSIEVDDKGSVKVKQFGKTVKEAGNEAEAGFKKAGKSLGDFDQQAERVIGSVKKLYAALAASVAVAALVAASRASIKLASDLEEVQGKFDVVFAGQTGKAEAWASNLSRNYNLTTIASKQYLASIQDLLVPMGVAAEQAGLLSHEVVKLAADLGSFNNLPTAQVMDDIQSALVGNYETMKKYGVVLSAATVEQKALQLGLAETKNQLTAADKAQAAFVIMMESSKAAIGDVQRTMESYANQTRLAQKNSDDLKTAYGQGLLPAVNDVVKQFNDWVKTNDALLKQDLEAWGKRTGAVIRGLSDAVGLFGKSYLGWSAIFARISGDAVELERTIARINNQEFGLKEELAVLREEQARLQVALGNPNISTAEYALLSSELSEVEIKLRETYIALDNQALGADKAAAATESAGTTSGGAALQIGNLGVQVDKAAKAWQNYQVATTKADSWLSRDQGMTKANERAEEMIQTLSDLDALVSDDAFFELAATMEAETKEATDASKALWEQFATDTGSIIEDFIGNTLRGEFDSIGDMFQGLLDSMLDMLISFIAKAAANDLINAIFGSGASGSTLSLMNLFSSSSSSGSSGSGGAGSLLSTGSTLYKGYKWLTGGKAATTTASGTTSAGTGTAAATGAGMSVYGYGSGAGTLGYTGAGGYVGGAVAEGGGLAAGSSGVGGSTAAAGGSAGAGAGIAVGGAYAMAALIALRVLKGFMDGPSIKVDSLLGNQLGAAGMSGPGLLGMYSGGLHEIADPVKNVLPSLAQFEKAMGDMNNGILVLTESAETNGGVMDVHALRYNELTGQFDSMGRDMNSLQNVLIATGAQTGQLSTAFIEQTAAQYGLQSSTTALVERFLGASSAAEYLAQGATTTQQALSSVSGALTQLANATDQTGRSLHSMIGVVGAFRASRAATYSLPSFDTGISYVPHDMIAQIHRGERVLTADENRSFNRGQMNDDNEVRGLLVEIVKNTKKSASILRNWDYTTMPAAREALQ